MAENLGSLEFDVTVNNANANKTLEEVADKLKETADAAKDASDALDDATKEIVDAVKDIKGETDDLSDTANDAADAQEQLADTLAETASAADDAAKATDTLGNGTGVVSYTIKDSGGSNLKTFSVPRYRGIENPFGHIWKWTDGALVNVVSGSSGTSAVYACSSPSLFSSTSYSNYRSVGNELRSNSYVKEIHFGEYGDITAKTGGGSANTYYHDYHYGNIGSTSLRGLLFGGIASNGAAAGLVYSLAYRSLEYGSGCRLAALLYRVIGKRRSQPKAATVHALGRGAKCKI